MLSLAQPMSELICGSSERVRSVMAYSTRGGTSAYIVRVVAFGSTQFYAGVPFEFRRGASSDFPAAIIIGDKVYYTHWTPAKAHMSHLQLTSRAAVDAEIAEAERELNSGAFLFIGGHGRATQKESVEFKIAYLNTIKSLLEKATTADEFASALNKAYPNLPGADGITALANALYQ